MIISNYVTCLCLLYYTFYFKAVWPYFLFLYQSTALNRILWWMLACLGLYTWPRWGRHLPLHPSPALLSSTWQHREGASLSRISPLLMANCGWNKWEEEGFLCILPTVLCCNNPFRLLEYFPVNQGWKPKEPGPASPTAGVLCAGSDRLRGQAELLSVLSLLCPSGEKASFKHGAWTKNNT